MSVYDTAEAVLKSLEGKQEQQVIVSVEATETGGLTKKASAVLAGLAGVQPPRECLEMTAYALHSPYPQGVAQHVLLLRLGHLSQQG